MTAAGEGGAGRPGSSPLERLRMRLPELLVETGFIVLAVLLALAVDEWREGRERAELAGRARSAIVAEIGANRDELAGVVTPNREFLASLDSLGAVGDTLASLSLQVELALLSSAAWSTAQATEAVHLIDYGWLTRVAQAYETQELFSASQATLLVRMGEAISELQARAGDRSALRGLTAQLRIVTGVQDALRAQYDQLLADEPVPDRSGAGR